MAKTPKSTTTTQPDLPVSLPRGRMDDDTRSILGQVCINQLRTELGNRKPYDEFLDYANDMYEMRTGRRNVPFEGAANFVVPIAACETDELTSRIVGSALVPRPLTVRGNDPNSSQYAHAVEQYHNGQYDRLGYAEAQETCIHLAARDGVAYMEILYENTVERRNRLIDTPVMGPDGNPQVGEDGQPVMEKVNNVTETVKWDAPRWTPVEARDLVLLPNYARSLEEADALYRKKFMGEADLRKMVNAKVLWANAVEKALSYVSGAQSEVTDDPQGTTTYTISERITISQQGYQAPDGMAMDRGPIQVWQVHTRQYDLDGDGVPEENILWLHDKSGILLGYAPYEYWGGRPFFDLSLMPRPNRVYGFGVPERVRGPQEEATALKLAQLDYIDQIVSPIRYQTPGARIDKEDEALGPGVLWRVNKPDDIGYINLPSLPADLFQEGSSMTQMASRLTGAPQMAGIPQAGGSQGRVSGRQAGQAAQIQGMQTNRMLQRVRRWMQRMFEFSHRLYIQYGKGEMSTVAQSSDGPKRVTLPREVLELDFTLGIAGMGGPLDKEGRRTDVMTIYQLFMQNPLVNGNLARAWNLSRMVLETFDVPEVTAFIGTLDEANQQAQAQAQAQQQQQQQQMMLQLISHGKTHSGPPQPGKPPAGPGGAPQ